MSLKTRASQLEREICACVHAQSCQTVVTAWTVAHQAPLSKGFSRQEYWSGLPFPTPGESDPGAEPVSPALAGRFFTIALPRQLKGRLANVKGY